MTSTKPCSRISSARNRKLFCMPVAVQQFGPQQAFNHRFCSNTATVEQKKRSLKEANYVHTRNIRLFSIGAQTLTGVGDARGLGWLGRVLAKTYDPDILIESYPLVFPNETTEELSERWEREVIPRLARNEIENRLVVAVPQDPIS